LNFKQRVERDKQDMIFFLKSDILKKVLPRIDDLQRMILNTPEEMKVGALFEGIVSMETKLISDLDKM
jgi:molecular chaperone GrpE (heat shock protein)